MHFSPLLHSAISTLAFLARCRLSTATPLGLMESQGHGLEKRCDNPCGYYNQLCCASGEVCSTDSNNEAVCLSGGGGGGSWVYSTTVYVQTETDLSTVTSVWSSWVATPTDSSCQAELGETICGNECCGASDVCSNGQCVAGSTTVWATETATPPVRGTSMSTVTQTATVTQPFEAPVNTEGAPVYGVDAPEDDGGLSGGAIAGIVIGTLAGVFLLFLICACLCCRGIITALLACLGIGKKKKDTTYVEEHYSHHGHHTRPEGRTWFGARPSGTDGGGEHKSRWSSLATIGIVLGAIALCLGLKRKHDNDEKSDYTYPSYYSYYTGTSTSIKRKLRSKDSTKQTIKKIEIPDTLIVERDNVVV